MNYYGVTRSTDHLAHYGVKGMRWGVRRALATGNQAALDRHYRKAAKKLAKLQKIGNSPYKSGAKAAAYGTAAATTGALALGGTGLASKGLRYLSAGAKTIKEKVTPVVYSYGPKGKTSRYANNKLIDPIIDRSGKAATALEEWGKKSTNINIMRPVIDEKTGKLVKRGAFGKNGEGINVSNNKLFRAGAALATAGLAAKAYQHGHRARNAELYRDKAERWKEEMDRNFAGTDYEGQYAKMTRKQQRRRRGYYT